MRAVTNVRNIVRRQAVEPVREFCRRALQTRQRLRREVEDVPASSPARALLNCGRFTENDMGVRAADSERAHARVPRLGRAGPCGDDVVDAEAGGSLAQLRDRCRAVDARWNLFVLQRQDRFDEPCDARRGFEMSDVRLHRAEVRASWNVPEHRL
jgi:hypothetical protein